jgi:bromodomain and WD repeat domain containing protein 1/3
MTFMSFSVHLEWLTGVEPLRSPYFPQIDDEVVYFRSGHQAYLNAVRKKKEYKLQRAIKPYKMKNAKDNQQDEVFARVLEIKHEVKPPRLVSLTLEILNQVNSQPTGEKFTVQYHDMKGVIDFIILRQHYENSLGHQWKEGDCFRSIIEDKWWFGEIMKRKENSSYFQCFLVKWDCSNQSERMSPWDLQPIREKRKSKNFQITEEERKSFYSPEEDDWPECGREEECSRIAQGLSCVMKLDEAEYFVLPVMSNYIQSMLDSLNIQLI